LVDGQVWFCYSRWIKWAYYVGSRFWPYIISSTRGAVTGLRLFFRFSYFRNVSRNLRYARLWSTEEKAISIGELKEENNLNHQDILIIIC
jgi:hypothetical protein